MTDRHTPGQAGLITVPGRPEPAGSPPGPQPLPGTPWSVRTAGGPGARPSLEIYAAGMLLDVVVATALPGAVLRGACRTKRAQAIAWGRLPADGPPVAVEFSASGLRQRAQPAKVTELGWWFWLATAEGEFGAVTVNYPGGRERRRLRRVRW